MSEPLNEKALAGGEGEGEALTPQSSALVPYRSSDYPGWSDWELRWRELVNAGGTVLCAPWKIRGTRLEAWAMDRQSVTNLSRVTTIRDVRFPNRDREVSWGICGCYNELPRLTRHMSHMAEVLKGSIVLYSCPKQRAYARGVLEILRRDRQYEPRVWEMMLREFEADDAEAHHRERLLKTFYAVTPDDMDAWITSIETGGQR